MVLALMELLPDMSAGGVGERSLPTGAIVSRHSMDLRFTHIESE